MIILGLDPGSRKFGFGLIKVQGNQLIYIDSGVINLSNEKSHWVKMKQIQFVAHGLKEKWNPDEVASEALIYHKNPQTLIKLVQARSAFCSVFLQSHENRIFEYAPNVVKKSLVGYGHATKEILQRRLQLPQNTKHLDESDALAVAICHLKLRKTSNR